MHTAGFWHEHMRPDRDTYVSINVNNVLPREYIQAYYGILFHKNYKINSFENLVEYRSNFNLLSTTEVTTLGLSYDYGNAVWGCTRRGRK
jgi:hypothetical protein